MMDYNKISKAFQEQLGLKYLPVGLQFTDKMPENALHIKNKAKACIAPLIFKSAKGKTIAFDKDSTGLPCASFYLGYTDWIFPGIEKFLSNESVFGREPEGFIESPEKAKKMVESFIPKEKRQNTVVFKPISSFEPMEKPTLIVFFANADQISALVYLISFSAPLEERIHTPFASACMSMFTIPLKYALAGKKKAIWGFHDVSARKTLPKDLMSITLTYNLFEEIYSNLDSSFLQTENWKRLKNRNQEMIK